MAFVRTRRRKTGTYYLVVDFENGRKVARSAGKDRRFAYRWAARLTELKARTRAGLPDESRFLSSWTLTVLKERDLEEVRLAGRETASRERRWAVILASLGSHAFLHEIDSFRAEEFRLDRLRLAKGATVNRDLSVCSSAWDLAVRFGAAQENPWKRVPRSKEKKERTAAIALPETAVARLIRLAWAQAGTEETWQSAAVVELVFLTGSRLSQILRLRASQVIGRDLVFPPQKGGLERVFALEGRLGKLVAECLRRSDGDWLFPSRRRKGPRENIRKFWTSLLKKAEIPRLRRHDLRHSTATAMAYRGAKTPAIQEMLGHGSPRMASEIYSHVHKSRMSAIVAGHPGGTARPKLRERRVRSVRKIRRIRNARRKR